MSEDFPPDDPGPVHNGTPTSRDAAESVAHLTGRMRLRVLGYLRGRGELGATADEVEVDLDMPGSTVRPRILELRGRKADGSDRFVRKTDRTRLTRGRRNAAVYVAIADEKKAPPPPTPEEK